MITHRWVDVGQARALVRLEPTIRTADAFEAAREAIDPTLSPGRKIARIGLLAAALVVEAWEGAAVAWVEVRTIEDLNARVDALMDTFTVKQIAPLTQLAIRVLVLGEEEAGNCDGPPGSPATGSPASATPSAAKDAPGACEPPVDATSPPSEPATAPCGSPPPSAP